MKKKLYKLEKISDDVFEGKHPNFILAGMSWVGIYNNPPTVGERFSLDDVDHMGLYLRTSTVTELLDDGLFKTRNSTYKLTEYAGPSNTKDNN